MDPDPGPQKHTDPDPQHWFVVTNSSLEAPVPSVPIRTDLPVPILHIFCVPLGVHVGVPVTLEIKLFVKAS
jgi:hypothetical protein